MTAKVWIELFGYLGSALVVVSMLMTSVMKLRIINTVGSVIFALYALIIRSYPTALMNFCLVAINIRQMIRLRDTEKQYELLEVDPGDRFLGYLLASYREDIRRYFPRFSGIGQDSRAYLVCCGRAPAGLLLGSLEDGELRVALDYTTPVYRDCSVGAYLYGQLKEKGIRRLLCCADSPEHAAYLRKMGFASSGPDSWVKVLGGDSAGRS